MEKAAVWPGHRRSGGLRLIPRNGTEGAKLESPGCQPWERVPDVSPAQRAVTRSTVDSSDIGPPRPSDGPLGLRELSDPLYPGLIALGSRVAPRCGWALSNAESATSKRASEGRHDNNLQRFLRWRVLMLRFMTARAFGCRYCSTLTIDPAGRSSGANPIARQAVPRVSASSPNGGGPMSA